MSDPHDEAVNKLLSELAASSETSAADLSRKLVQLRSPRTPGTLSWVEQMGAAM